jgi:hypothetical protein
MAMANTERKSVASSRKCCHSTIIVHDEKIRRGYEKKWKGGIAEYR